MRRFVLRGVVVVVVFVGLVAVMRGVAWVTDDQQWLAAVDRAVGLGLFLVTGAYVLLTFQMVNVLRRQPAQSTVRELLSVLVPVMEEVAHLLANFPFAEADAPPDPRDIDKGAFGLDQIRKALTRAVPQVPNELGGHVMEAERHFRTATNHVNAFAVSIAMEHQRADQEGTDWRWERARGGYEDEVQSHVPDQPEWERVARGEALDRARQAVTALITAGWGFLNR